MLRNVFDYRYLLNHHYWSNGYSFWCVLVVTVSLEKPNYTQDSVVTNFRLSWRLFPFILFNAPVVLAAKQFHIASLPPQPLTDCIVFVELMASPSHLQIYRWSLWPNPRRYRKMDAVQTLCFSLPAAGLRRKQAENRTHIKSDSSVVQTANVSLK